jgi:hypothetical protein
VCFGVIDRIESVGTWTYEMEGMRPLVKVVHDQVYPCRLGAGREGELVCIPALSGETDQWYGWVILGFPGTLVEVAFGDVVITGHFLDLSVDDLCLLDLGR